jgi:hypothetical protein
MLCRMDQIHFNFFPNKRHMYLIDVKLYDSMCITWDQYNKTFIPACLKDAVTMCRMTIDQ